MLLSLSIRDIVLIERLDLRFKAGLCVLTGETGAGKSILLDALTLALGGRGDAGLVRHGAAQGSVAATFDLDPHHPVRAIVLEQGLDAPDEEPLILRRVLGADGRGRAMINDQPVSVGLLRRCGELLVELHAQGAERGLLDPEGHRMLLDSFGGLDADALAVRKAYGVLRDTESNLAKAVESIEQAKRDEDYLRYVLAELDRLAIEAGEETKLADERSFLMQSEKITQAFGDAEQQLSDGVSIEQRLRLARRAMERVVDRAGDRLGLVLAQFDVAQEAVAELGEKLAQAARAIDADPGRLERVEERLFALRAAARKHGCSVDDLATKHREFSEKLAAIESGDADIEKLTLLSEQARKFYHGAARKLSAARKKAAASLDKTVAAELNPLKLGQARFVTAIEGEVETAPASEHGCDRVQFLIATNPNQPLAPMAKVASGGELSRFMLALRVVLARQGNAPTMIFDEVDQGIGGATADAVGERLVRLAARLQVLVVTHSPQVAARGQSHWHIAKQVSGNGKKAGTSVDVRELAPDERHEEVARMLAGAEVTDAARAAARSLLQTS